MREDMAKIIVERPRTGGSYASRQPRFNRWKHLDWDEQPRQIGKLRQWRTRKDLNENLAPLKRFLFSRVGRPWSEVHRELRERINIDSAVQLHIWQHVEDFVSVHVYKAGETVRAYNYWRQPRWMYVDPDTGLLCKVEHVSRKKRGRRLKVKMNEYLYVLRVEGRWRKVVLKNLPLKDWKEKWDALFSLTCGRVGQELLTKTHGIGRYAVAVLPLTHDEEKDVEKSLRQKR
jgi:hypothetical protein